MAAYLIASWVVELCSCCTGTVPSKTRIGSTSGQGLQIYSPDHLGSHMVPGSVTCECYRLHNMRRCGQCHERWLLYFVDARLVRKMRTITHFFVWFGLILGY
jgi:hypothetical protein